ncbi:Rossmann-like alpha/beta/alpha sandwich [Corchorus capsularis]|uniref:tyrosine--tRNA ligase n=1 Tax=Corchorus capsularis TaxID=210143 RepID=A0A1R3FXE6_COCAP|nr:Rossmann-like alpha/beta/alpha sandwich [Corchorus capsularis]
MADQWPLTDKTPPSYNLQLSLEKRFQIIRSVNEECIHEDELLNLLKHKPEPICCDSFEPSGRMHIAQVYLFMVQKYGTNQVGKLLSGSRSW